MNLKELKVNIDRYSLTRAAVGSQNVKQLFNDPMSEGGSAEKVHNGCL